MSLVLLGKFQHFATIANTNQAKNIYLKRFLSGMKYCNSSGAVIQLRDRKSLVGSAQNSIASSNSLEKEASLLNAVVKHQSFNEIIEKPDYTAYQDADLRAFFTEDTVPQQVSEICVVNDHFMLVKMPQNSFRKSSQTELILEEEFTEPDPTEAEIGNTRVQADEKDKAKMCRYFQYRNRRRITPARDGATVAANDGNRDIKSKMHSLVNKCWHVDGSNDSDYNRQITVTRTVQEISTAPVTGHKKVLDLSVKRVTIQTPDSSNRRDSKKELQQPIQASAGEDKKSSLKSVVTSASSPTISDALSSKMLQTSQRDAVQLEHHACLVSIPSTPEKATNSHSNTELERTETGKKPKLSRKLRAFRWLLNPFRLRSTKVKTPKPKSKIHAVIYKTYFVHWQKPADVTWRGYGTRRESVLSEVPILKRCRSAVF